MSVTPKSMWPAVKAMLHSVYDQPDKDAVNAQFDRLLDYVEEKLPDAFEESLLDPLTDPPSYPGTDGTADQEADHQHEEKGEDLIGWKPVREELGEWPHQLPD